MKLPTDGYRSATTLQQVFGNKASDGQSGASRPMPTSAPQGNPNGPQVGELNLPNPGQGPQSASSNKDAKLKKKGDRANDVGPGFSLN